MYYSDNIYGQFHGIVDMALKFQIHDITNKLVYKFYPYVEIQETKRIKAIGQIFFEIQLQT